MKIGLRLKIGFLSIAFLVLVTGYFGFKTVDVIEKQSSILFTAKALFANIIGMRDAMHESLSSKQPGELKRIQTKYKEYSEIADIWSAALLYGTDSIKFKSKDTSKIWQKSAYRFLDIKVPFDPKISARVQRVSARFKNMHTNALKAMKIYAAELSAREHFNEKYIKGRQNRISISNQLDAITNPELSKDLSRMVYSGNEALFQYKDKQHLDKWLKAIQTLKQNCVASNPLPPDQLDTLLNNLDEYYTISQTIADLILEIKQKESERSVKTALVDKDIIAIDRLTEELNVAIAMSVGQEKKRATRAFMSVSGFIVVLAFLIALFTSHSILDPISKFRDTALEISQGNLNVSVKTELKDEIGQLADVFNEMVKKLNELYDNLEKQVRERTAELEKTNKDLGQEITEHMLSKEALLESEKKYKELSITDGLTNLYNSRHFFNQLELEANRASRYNRPLALLLIDVDNFKLFNDTYGHIEGDKVLLSLGKVILNCTRKTDSAYRYGGEEFTVVLLEAGVQEALVVGERIRKAFEMETFAPQAGDSVHITVSIGVANHCKDEKISDFVKRADKSMYSAKNQGKNRVIFSE